MLIPTDKVWKDRDGEHCDPDDAIKLMLVGDNNHGNIYTREAWEQQTTPLYLRTYGEFTHLDGVTRIDPTEARLELLPELCVVKIEEREYWVDPFIRLCTTRIFGVYLFNRRKHVHMCEITPSYETIRLGSQWDEIEGIDERDHDQLWDDIHREDCLTESRIGYRHVSDMERALLVEIREGFLPPGGKRAGGFVLTGVKSVLEDDAIREVEEAYSASEF